MLKLKIKLETNILLLKEIILTEINYADIISYEFKYRVSFTFVLSQVASSCQSSR